MTKNTLTVEQNTVLRIRIRIPNTDPDSEYGFGFRIWIRVPNTDPEGLIEYGSGWSGIRNTVCWDKINCYTVIYFNKIHEYQYYMAKCK